MLHAVEQANYVTGIIPAAVVESAHGDVGRKI